MATDTGLVACGEKLNKYLQIKRFISQIMWMGDIVIFSKSNEHYFEKKHLYTSKINAIFADGRKQIELWKENINNLA